MSDEAMDCYRNGFLCSAAGIFKAKAVLCCCCEAVISAHPALFWLSVVLPDVGAS